MERYLAQLAMLFAEAHRDPKQREDPFTADDFMITWGEPDEDDEDAAEEALQAQIIAAFPMAVPNGQPG